MPKTPAQTYVDTASNPSELHPPLLEAGSPVMIDSSENVMYPLRLQKEDDENGGSGSFIGKERVDNAYWNIIFYNTQTGRYHLLDSTRKMAINSYNTSYSNSEYGYSDSDLANYHGEQLISFAEKGKHIFYLITTDDINKDGVLNNRDPTYLFMSDKAGDNFKQISPRGLTVNEWTLIERSGKILIQTIGDDNHNNLFNDDSNVVSYIYDLRKNVSAQRIFNNAFTDKVNQTRKKLWPVKKAD